MQIETMRVRVKGVEEPVVINKADFNPNIHQDVQEKVAQIRKKTRVKAHSNGRRKTRRAA